MKFIAFFARNVFICPRPENCAVHGANGTSYLYRNPRPGLIQSKLVTSNNENATGVNVTPL